MSNAISRYFQLEPLGTTVHRELVGGLTTFVTMAYIIVVNPKILEAAGIPFGPSLVATVLSAFFGTLLMGVYARRPFAVAPYMGENAFIAFTVVKVMGYSWQTALGAIFIGGVLFILITVLRVRSWLAEAIPTALKIGFTVGIGIFLTFIGLNETGIVVLGTPGAPVHVGNLHDPQVVLALVAFAVMILLMLKKVRGAILIGILGITGLAIVLQMGVAGISAGSLHLIELPHRLVSLPPDLSPIFLKLDVHGALSWGFFSVLLTVFVMDFVDTMGTLLGLSYRAGLLDDQGNLPQIEKPMLCDALATTVGALLGTTTTGAYVESAAGIEAGARSGLASVFTALLFLLALFFSPFLTIVPAYAYGPALMIVGMLMLSPIQRIDFTDLTEVVPVFVTIMLMSFTYNLGIGMTAGFVSYPLLKIANGNAREISSGLWGLFAMSLLFFIFYPY